MAAKKPKRVGIWVIGILGSELTKWGRDGDTEFPFLPNKEKDAVVCAYRLATSKEHADDRFYILRVFDNGQMKQFEFDPAEYRRA